MCQYSPSLPLCVCTLTFIPQVCIFIWEISEHPSANHQMPPYLHIRVTGFTHLLPVSSSVPPVFILTCIPACYLEGHFMFSVFVCIVYFLSLVLLHTLSSFFIYLFMLFSQIKQTKKLLLLPFSFSSAHVWNICTFAYIQL